MGKKEKSAHIKHMESLGYTCKKRNLPGVKDFHWLACYHDEYACVTFVSTKFDDLIMFCSGWPVTNEGASHFNELMFLSNEINRYSTISRSIALTQKMMGFKDDEINTRNPHQIMLQAFYYGIYDKKSFTKFLDNWHNDIVRMDSNPIYNKFFRPKVEGAGLA